MEHTILMPALLNLDALLDLVICVCHELATSPLAQETYIADFLHWAIRPPRFDPTAYIRDRDRKQKDVDLKKGRRALASPSSMRGQRRSSSVESLQSHRSYQSSGDEMEYVNPLPSSGERKQTIRGRKPFAPSSWNNRNSGKRDRSSGKKRLSSTPNYDRKIEKENRFDQVSDLSDIDARLQALQDYMKNLDTRT